MKPLGKTGSKITKPNSEMQNQPADLLRLDVPRHLQDYNGYCGPACALMVIDSSGSQKSPPVYAQNEIFKEIRGYAKAMNDRRSVKSPAESLLSLLNSHAKSNRPWKKVFQPDSKPVADQIFHALEALAQPCLLLVSRGMHWVVAFGRLRKNDGSLGGILLRDPAWAGMPHFYGLSIFPKKPAIKHTASPCSCLEQKTPPGTVHERYLTVDELISPRGLQGSPDWEGRGAIALIPDESTSKSS
ncbi:MAG: hypothetical protein AAGC74_10445 [Verrucomicrobiota bacterium]